MSDDPRAHVTRPIDMLVFATAGNAIFTLQGQSSRFTYRMRQSEDGKVFFVSVLVGSDNEDSYKFAGSVRNEEYAEFKSSAKAKISAEAPSVKAFTWFWHQLVTKNEENLAKLQFWHEGRCGRCGRTLTVPASIERGIGPECATKMECF